MEAAIVIAALLLVLGISFGYPTTHVDLVELNHYFDMRGHLVYDQVIFWEFNPANGKFQVRSWCLCEGSYPVTSDGITKFENKDYRVSGSLFRESWSQVDPERANQKIWPESRRHAVPLKHQPKKLQE